MKPDAYMPFYGDDFLRAIKGKPPFVGLAYLKAVWHYWTHEHCEGLPDVDEELQAICELNDKDWDQARTIIFDNNKFFTQDGDGLWHQKRAANEWAKVESNYQKALVRAQSGAKARWKGHKRHA